MLNLCLEPLDFETIETDAKQSIKCRQRATLNEDSSNPFKNRSENPEAPFRYNSQQYERYSLVPYDNYRSSIISVERASNSMSRESLRRSSLYESFSSKNAYDDPIIKDLTGNAEKMLSFFDMDKKSEKGHLP